MDSLILGILLVIWILIGTYGTYECVIAKKSLCDLLGFDIKKLYKKVFKDK